jgi:hypothetical protein
MPEHSEKLNKLSIAVFSLARALDDFDDDPSEHTFDEVSTANQTLQKVLAEITTGDNQETKESPFQFTEDVLELIQNAPQRTFKSASGKAEAWSTTKEQFITELKRVCSRVEIAFNYHDTWNNWTPNK